jgi:hypothetical protein
VGEANGKAKRKRGKCKRGRGGHWGAKSDPNRQRAAPVAVQETEFVLRGNGQI